jgi:tetratricopeptide (TPR) repeat protein
LRILLFLALLLAPLASRAAPDCPGLLDQAKTQFADGAFKRAQSTLERALSCSPPPPASQQARIHLLLGLVHATHRDRNRAREAFRRALKYDPGIRLDPRRNRADFVELLETLRGQLVGQVTVATTVGGAEVWADGKVLCRPPCAAPLVAGPYRLVLRGPEGRVLASRAVEVSPGHTTSVELSPAPSTRPASARASRPATPGPAPGPAPLGPAPASPRQRLWTWVAAGAAVATAAAALGLSLSARGDHDEACDLLSGDGPCDERTHLADPADASRYSDLHTAMERKSLAANICWGVAGGLAVTAAVLYWLEPGWGDEVQVALLPGTAGLVVGLSY